MAKAALELYSIRELMQKDVLKSLEQTKKAGYDGVEFAGFYDMPAKQIKSKLDELNLKVCGSHTSLDLIEANMEEVFTYNNIICNKNIVVPFLAENLRKDIAGWENTAKKFNEIGKKCADNGFIFAYHNHTFEFETFNGITGYQVLIDNINPKYVKLQPDLGWVFYAGEDVNNFLEKYSTQIMNIHVKQFKQLGSHDATEVHKGMVDYPPIISKCIALGIEWFIIEQEGFDIPMLESIEENCIELKKMF